MEENREYADALQHLLTLVLRSTDDKSIFLNENMGKPAYVFVITSDMGFVAVTMPIFKELYKVKF